MGFGEEWPMLRDLLLIALGAALGGMIVFALVYFLRHGGGEEDIF